MLKKLFSFGIPVLLAGLVFAPNLTTAQGCNALYSLIRVSVSSGEAEGNGESNVPSLSGSGRYVAYYSAASNLVANDDNGVQDVFVFDRQTCQTERISVSTTGTQGNLQSAVPQFSRDGQRVVFESEASTLVAGDNNNRTDIFQRSLSTDQTTLVSLADDEEAANDRATLPITNSDGRFIAFASLASNMVDLPVVPNEFQAYIRDRMLSTTELISVATNGQLGNNTSFPWSITDDARYVAFESEASNLIPVDGNAFSDVFIRDRQLGTTTRISNGIGGTAPNAQSYQPAISNDGRFVAFASRASNLVTGDTTGGNPVNSPFDVFLYDVQAGTTTLISFGLNGVPSNGSSWIPSISGDGRFVVFESDATNLVTVDANGTGSDIFLYDRITNEISLVSVKADGTQSNDSSYFAEISADGTTISYQSWGTNLVSNDSNNTGDIFVAPRYVVTGGSLLANGDFDAGFAGWGAFGDPAGALDYRIENGVLEFSRAVRPQGGDNTAVVLQESGYPIANGGGLDATVDLGNSSAARKRVTILLHDSDFSDLQVCTFWLPPNSPLRQYRMTARTTEAWANATISIYAATADGIGYYQVDNAALKLVPPPTSNRTMCYDPDAPPANPEEDSDDWITNGTFDDGFNGWLEFFAIETQVTGGVLEFYGNGTPAGVAFQETANEVPEGTVIEARFDLGSSAPRRRITILLRDADFSDLTACTFWLAPNAPLQTYVIRAYTTEDWTGASISFYPATQGSNGWYRVDNVSFKARPNKSIIGTECYPPGTAPADLDAIHVDPLDLYTRPDPTATPSGEGTLGEGNFYAQPGAAPEMPLMMTPTPTMIPVESGEGTIGE